MPQINLSNEKGRDATVNFENVRHALRVRWVDADGKQNRSVRVLKSTLSQSLAGIQGEGDLESVSQKLVDGDPEVDVERVGSLIQGTRKVFLDADQKVMHAVRQEEVLHNPDGSEKERRPLRVLEQNLCTETPLKWTGKLFKKSQVFNRFVFQRKLQVVHVNGLTYDFLYNMAKELEAKDSVMLVAGGAKGNEPLVVRRGGTPCRGFLEGRTKGDEYCLLLHLSSMELKAPKVSKLDDKVAARKERDEAEAAKEAARVEREAERAQRAAEKEEEQKQKEAERARKEAEREAARKAKEEEKARKAAEREAARKAKEEEKARKAAEKEAAKKAREAEKARKAAEKEAARKEKAAAKKKSPKKAKRKSADK